MIKLFSVPHYLQKKLTLRDSSFKTKKWDELKTEFDLIENQNFFIAQITHVLPISWKKILRNYAERINNLVIQDHHLIKNIKYFPLIN